MQDLIRNLSQSLLEGYEQNKVQNWCNKKTLLNLLITASIGRYTYVDGATEMLISSDLLYHYFDVYVMPEIFSENIDELPLLKSTCIKFIYFFRKQIPDHLIRPVVSVMVGFLKS